MYKNWGFEQLDDKAYHASIKQMKLADDVIQRVLFLEGIPNLQDLGKLRIGEEPKEMLESDLELEMHMASELRSAIAYLESVKDYVSRELLEKILKEEEEYIDWIETQFSLIENTGLKNYLQSMIEDD